MIQAITATNIESWISTEDNRINTSIVPNKGNVAGQPALRHLFKFTNDMDGSVQYAYSDGIVVSERYTQIYFTYNATPNVILCRVNLKPSGYWKYECFEVTWNAYPDGVGSSNTPVTELQVLEVADTNGVVQGLVTKGKLYLAERDGTEQVQYIQNAKSVLSLTIEYGGAGYTSAPTITITGDNITQATATCTVAGGAVNTITITNAGSGYTENPVVSVSGGGATAKASIVAANIEQDNYIYYGQ